MRPKFLTWLPVIGLMAAAATPAMAQGNWFGGPAPSYSYQSPDGSYPSEADVVRSIRGIPCGIECSQQAATRWGLVPPPPPSPYQAEGYNSYHYGY